jgi:hypothetical protein
VVVGRVSGILLTVEPNGDKFTTPTKTERNMKTHPQFNNRASGHRIPSSVRKAAASALLAIGLVSPSQAVVVSISGVDPVADQQVIDFISTNFSNVSSVTYGNYADPANIPAGTELLIIGRRVFSGEYGNAANSSAFLGLSIPIVALTSYVTRPDGDRWAWHDGGVANGGLIAGDETTVTAAGAGVFGTVGAADWWATSNGAGDFNAAGTGSVGGGEILATMGGNILVAHWDAGDLSAGSANVPAAAFGGSRLLFNIPDADGNGKAAMPDTAAGQAAFRNAVDAYTPLTAVPEPSGSALLLGSLGMLALRRRRSA